MDHLRLLTSEVWIPDMGVFNRWGVILDHCQMLTSQKPIISNDIFVLDQNASTNIHHDHPYVLARGWLTKLAKKRSRVT